MKIKFLTICLFIFIIGKTNAQDVAWPGLNLGTLSCAGSPYVYTGNTTGSINDCSFYSSGGDHIYQFTIANQSDVTIDLCGSAFDTYLLFYNITSGSCAGSPISANDDACGLQSTITQTGLAAGTYVVIIEGYGGATGNYNLNIAISNCIILTPMSFVSSTASQPNTSSVSVSSTNQEVIRLEVVTTGTTSPLSATQFLLRTDGTTNVADISNAKIWYTGASSIYATTAQFGATIAVPPSPGTDMTFNGSQVLISGTNYFWLSYDVKPGATIGNFIDGKFQQCTISAVNHTPTTSTPAGSRQIANSCTHTIRLTDTFGDGWNGGTVTVTVNGTPVLTNITLAAGFGPQDFTFSASTGDIINVTCTASGSYPAEMRVEVIAGSGASILSTTQPVTTPGTNVTGCCASTVPGVATNPTPANGTPGINPCSLDLLWSAPVSSGCNGATSYDIYFGTSATPPFLINKTTTLYSLPNALLDNTTYYWKIVPKNTAGSAAGCPIWSFTTGTTTNSLYCFYGNTTNYPAAGANCAQLTPNVGNQNGCAWNRTQISFASSFDYSVSMYFGAAAGGADGCAFVFQNAPAGISQCGNTGGQLGAGGIPNAVVIEFDTYDNDFPAHVYDMSVDHTAIEVDGNLMGPGAPLAGPVQADPLDGLLADGLLHVLRITWNPVTQIMAVWVDGSLRLSCNYDFITNVFGGNPNVWWGFTASTGALANQQYFCPISIPLPVTISEFVVDCKDGKHKLDWYSAAEINNDFYTIESSINGVDFTQLTKIKGAGNSNDALHYSWIDNSESTETVYYRLSQTDIDGKTVVIGIKSIQCNKNQNNLSIKLALASDYKVLTEFETQKSGNYTIDVMDMTGRLISSISNYFESGLNRIDILAPAIGKGMYIISVKNESESAFRKFVVN